MITRVQIYAVILLCLIGSAFAGGWVIRGWKEEAAIARALKAQALVLAKQKESGGTVETQALENRETINQTFEEVERDAAAISVNCDDEFRRLFNVGADAYNTATPAPQSDGSLPGHGDKP